MGQEQQFDDFYQRTRRALVHQTFALTGNLPAAQSAVRDAFIAAWHHWRKVATYDDPLDWVRPRAWQLAQRRRSARPWHREKGLTAADKVVLDALAKLPVGQRRTLLLTQLAGVPTQQAAREVGVRPGAYEELLQTASARFAVSLDANSATLRSHLLSLADAAAEAKLPRASIVRRAGKKRRQSHTALAAGAATVVAVASGAFVHQPSEVRANDAEQVEPAPTPEQAPLPGPPSQAENAVPTAAQLLDEHQIQRLGLDQRWRVTRTHDNTSGSGINTVCQESRFADPDGISAVVRHFEARRRPARSAVQTIEVSETPEQATDAFATTVGWYAGCHVGRLQLLNAYRVDGIGDQAHVLMIRVWEKPVTTYSVAVARIGKVTTSTVGKTVGAEPAPAAQITQSLADAVSMLCSDSGADQCAPRPTYSVVPPPPSGEEPGLLAVADLPPVGRIDQPWVGTRSHAARRSNPAATVCDRTSFARSGAQQARSRTFLIPGAKVPSRFGLSETYGVFRTPKAAGQFLNGVRRKLARCEDENLATQVRYPRTINRRGSGMSISTWNLETEVSERETVRFRLGFVKVGNKVAQVTFAPTDRNDVASQDFVDLVHRAGDRLRELG